MARTYNELNELVRKAQKINQAQGETLVALANAVNGLEEGKVNVIDVENIKALTDEQCNSLRCGDIVRKITDGQKHCYIVSFKKDGVGMCLTYADATVVETQSYDYTNSHWVYNSEDKNSLEQYELPVASADTLGGIKVGSGLSITDGVLSASGGSGGSNKYQHNITLTTTNFGIITFNFIDENSNAKTTASEIYTSLYSLGFYYNTSMATTDYKYVSASGGYISNDTLIVITGVINFRGATQRKLYILTNTSTGIDITNDITNITDNVIALY